MAFQQSAMRARLLLWSGPAALVATVAPVRAQLPVSVPKSSGQTVTPAYEGWYRNPDGTFSCRFGYYNRNTDEVVESPDRREQLRRAGAAEPGTADRVSAAPPLGCVRREGARGLRQEGSRLDARVPRRDLRDSRHPAPELADRCARRRSRIGQHAAGAAGSPRTGPEGTRAARHHGRSACRRRPGSRSRSRLGAGRRQGGGTSVGERRPRRAVPVTLAWFKHQGRRSGRRDVQSADRRASTGAAARRRPSATFSAPGEYIVRVRANDASGSPAPATRSAAGRMGFSKSPSSKEAIMSETDSPLSACLLAWL